MFILFRGDRVYPDDKFITHQVNNMSEQFLKKPKNDDSATVLDKPKGLPRFGIDLFSIIMIVVLTCVIVLAGLMLIGPAISNIYSNMFVSL